MKIKEYFSNESKNWHARAYFKFLKLSGQVDVKLKKTLSSYGITHAQLNVLNQLVRNHPSTMDAKTLKDKLIVPSPDLTRLLDRLVKKGFVTRITCPDNRRKLDINVTDNGIKVFFEIHTAAKSSVNDYFESNLSKEDAKVLFKILNQVEL